ncbi:MAG: hypothetical protein GEV06_22995 [Luteitalea sp.]|nr:hypothetical protein [Luteitalea sp.]
MVLKKLKRCRPRTAKRRKPQAFTLGRDSFDKISAVEGIRLSPEIQEDFREFDQRGLSAHERRRAIVRKYGRKLA